MNGFLAKLLPCLALNLALASKQPHLIFILVDDMGFNDFYSSSDLADAWPNVAALAKSDCVKVEEYYTMPLCTPTRAAFMSGRHPTRLGLQHGVIVGQTNIGLPLDEATLPEKLSAVGYTSIGVGKWHLGMYNNASLPTRRGFKHFYGYFNGAEDYYTHEVQRYLDLHDDEQLDFSQNGVYSAYLFTQVVEQRIREHKERNQDSPLFLYFPLQTVHSPLEAPDEYTNSEACKNIPNKDRKTFCGMARAADDSIGNVTKALEKAFPAEDVLIIISGDNGGLPMDGGNNCPDYDTFCLRGHKAEQYEGGIRNNALVCSKTLVPDSRKGGRFSKGLVHVMDWHATLRDLAGASDKAGKPVDAVSAWDAIIKDEPSLRTEFLINIDPCTAPPTGASKCMGSESGYRFGDWKLLVGVGSDTWYPVPSSTEQALPGLRQKPSTYTDKLYNITADPVEKKNLASKYPDVVKQIKAKIKTLADEALAPCNAPGGSCASNDPRGLAMMKQMKGWVPWVPDNETDAEGLIVI